MTELEMMRWILGILITAVAFAVTVMYFWVHKAGYKKEALLMDITSTALTLIVILALAYYSNIIYG